MGMGFILPFALTFVAIPLESFIHALRTVLGMLLAGSLAGARGGAAPVGDGFRYVGRLLVDLYDVLIFLPPCGSSSRSRGISRQSAGEAAAAGSAKTHP